MKNKLIVFDIDDTLYNEIDYVKSGYKEVSKYIEKKYNKKNVYKMLMSLFDTSSKNVFNRLFDDLKIEYSNEDIMFLVNTYRNHKPKIKLARETISVINELKNNYKLAIVSDGNYNTQKAKCNSLELDKYFDMIILTDEYGKDYWKPSRKAFDLLSNEFHVRLSDMYYIGDNPNKDFYISKYGINTIRYYNKNGIYYNSEYKENIKEKHRIDNLNEIKKIIN